MKWFYYCGTEGVSHTVLVILTAYQHNGIFCEYQMYLYIYQIYL